MSHAPGAKPPPAPARGWRERLDHPKEQAAPARRGSAPEDAGRAAADLAIDLDADLAE